MQTILGKYFHDTAMELTLTDALFSLEYLAINVGGTITASSNVFTTEQITTSAADTLQFQKHLKSLVMLEQLDWYHTSVILGQRLHLMLLQDRNCSRSCKWYNCLC